MCMPSRKYTRPGAWFAPSAALAIAALALGACLRPPDYPLEPVVEFVGLTRDTMDQGSLNEDSISVVISFTDGDGDIAFDDGDTTRSVYLVNVETGVEQTAFKIDPIDEVGVENGIRGEFRLRVFNTCCDYPDFVDAFPCEPSAEYPIDTLLLEAFMIDRAGNESNRAAIAPIYLRCDR